VSPLVHSPASMTSWMAPMASLVLILWWRWFRVRISSSAAVLQGPGNQIMLAPSLMTFYSTDGPPLACRECTRVTTSWAGI